MAVRAVKFGRMGFASGTDTSLSGINDLFCRARDAAEALATDRARKLPRPAEPRPFPHPALSQGERENPASISPKLIIQRLKDLERRALAGDRRLKKALHLSFHETSGVHAIVNSEGVAAAEPWSAVSFSVELLGASGNETETCWGSDEKRRWSDLNPEAVVDDARERLLTSFGARPLRSGKWPVILTPRVGVEFLDLVSQAVMGDAVHNGRSYLSNQMGKKVAASGVTLVDDGTLPGGMATGRWDDEGVPRQRTVVVNRGTLGGFLHDTTSAGRAKVSSTGNASRPGRDAPPSPGTTNFYLAAGAPPRETLYQSTPRAFVVRDVIGMHTADPVSGDFSVGASGILWGRGKPVRAVRGVTLSGNLAGLLSNVDAVANDLTWQGSFGAPTFRVKALSVGGSR